MARTAGRVAHRVWSCCRSAAKNPTAENYAPTSLSMPSSSASSTPRPFPRKFTSPYEDLFGGRRQSAHFTRLPAEIGSIFSMIPRHDATAVARLVSKLSTDLSPGIEGAFARYVSPI